jgi:hypothetical protein
MAEQLAVNLQVVGSIPTFPSYCRVAKLADAPDSLSGDPWPGVFIGSSPFPTAYSTLN